METEQQVIAAVQKALANLGFGERAVHLRQIPFDGTWGYATPIAMQLASETTNRAVNGSEGKKGRVDAGAAQIRAQEIAESLANELAALGAFSRVEAVRGYVNAYLNTGVVARDLVANVLTRREQYGHGTARSARVMVEYSQPNTHKAMHIGHLRNVAIGSAMVNILRFAGYPVVAANYIGDIGMHVIKCLWCLRSFHANDIPVSDRGRWLGQIYAEAETRLGYREALVNFVQTMSAEGHFRPYADRLVKELWRRGAHGEDVAYMLGQLSNEPRLDVKKFRDPEAFRMFLEIMGPWLRDQVAEGRIPETWLAQYETLAVHLDWFEASADWEQEVKDTFQLWEAKDPALITLWEVTRRWSLDEFDAIYHSLDAVFDIVFYESEVEDEGRLIVQELLERGIAEVSEGLPVVKIDEKLGLDKEKYRVLPVLRSDGTTLYSTKDLALAKAKFERYQIDRALYVVDVRQSLYLQQIFKVLELWGFGQAKDCFHLAYEFLSMPDGAMSSRRGNVIVLEDVMDEALRRARAIVDEKNPNLPDEQKNAISAQVAIGGVKYYMLARDRNSVIIFDWEKALSLDGQSAPYIQYAHARACNILEKAGVGYQPSADVQFTHLTSEEINLIQEIARFAGEVERAAAGYNPLPIANYAYQLAKSFHDFYHACPVNSAEEPVRSARLALVAASRQVLANTLGLIGIGAPAVM